jgi:UDP-N-acetylmuramoyl-tripeptide--D-alanyl-D-alanine ligase
VARHDALEDFHVRPREAARTSPRLDLHTIIDGTGFVTRFTLRAPPRFHPIDAALAGRHNVLNALCAAAAACAAGATLDECAPGSPQCARFLADCSSKPRQRCLDRRRLLQRESQLHEGRIEVLAASMRAAGWSWATWASSATTPRKATRHRPLRAQSPHRPAVRHRQAVGAGGRGFGAAANGSRHRDLARAVNAELTREVCVLVKGSRSNRLERVVEALVAALRNTEPLNKCSTGSPSN